MSEPVTDSAEKVKLGGVKHKGPLCPESLSYQKKDGRAWPRPSFFSYDTDFSNKKKKFQKKSK